MRAICKALSAIFIRAILALYVLLLFSGTAPYAQEAAKPVKIGVLAKRGAQRCLEKWGPTAEYLTREIPCHSFTIVPLDFDEIYPAVEQEEVDFILTNSSFYVGLELIHGANRIATLKNLRLGKVSAVFGGVIFCRANRKDLKHLDDLRGKKFMAASEKSFGGWQMAWREFKEHGIDPYRDFDDLSFGGTHDAVVYAVLNGEVDAGTVRTDALERMALEGKINLDDFYIFHDHESPYKDTPFLHSTRPYPEWPFAKIKHTSDELAEQVAIALLKMPPDGLAARAAICAGWTIPLNYQPVHDCLKYLRITPYEDYGKVTFRNMIRQYLPWFLGVLIALITLFSFYVTHLNRKLRIALEGQSKELVERKQAEKKLRESEERFRTIFDTAQDSIFIKDCKFKYTHVNPAMERLFGLPVSKLIGQSDMELFGEEAGLHVREVDSRVLNGEIIEEEHTKPVKGNSVTFHVIKVPMRNSDGEIVGLCGIARDITERKQAEEALKTSEVRFRSIIESIPNISAQGYDHNRTVIFWNTASEKLYGYTKEEAIGKKLEDLIIPPHMKQQVINGIKQWIDNGQKFPPGELGLMRSDGSIVPVYSSHVLLENYKGDKEMYCLDVDLTELKQAEEALKKSEKRYRELFNSVMEGIAIIDKNEIIKFCNPACAGIFEVDSVKAIEGKCLLEYVPEQQKELVSSQTEIRKRGLSSQYELEIVTARGNNKTVLFSASPRYDDSDNFIGSFNAIMDITETKQLQESAERAKRLEAAGKIAGQVAHDFNNLLGPLVAYPDFIKNELPEDHTIIPLLNDMESAALHMADINQQLLTLGRRGHYSQVPLNLNEIIPKVINQMKPHPKELVIDTDLFENLMNIKAGPAQIHRVILNLLNNAKDAMGNIGQLTIKTENYYVDTVSGKYEKVPKGEYVKLSISDNGCGISDEVHTKIFDPFFTTKTTNKKRGSGLGLSVVDAVVKDHNGYIDFESTIGKGTSFYLYFSITRETVENSIPEEITGGTESILVIDDDKTQRDVTLRLLKNLGYKSDAVASGEKAVELLKKSPRDLLLLDMVMPPGIDGTETYRRALAINPFQKAVIVSGYSETERVEEALKLGAGAYIKKPLTLKTIAAAIRKELDRVTM